MIDLSKIQNGHLLTDVFGKFPSFHDSEVHRINLIRETRSFGPTLTALIHVFEVIKESHEKKRRFLESHAFVEFRFSKVSDLEIVGFNYQNVLQSLEITEVVEAETEKPKYEISFEGIFGVSARFYCEEISIESVEPYVP
ncbi:MAG: hypothetical protein IPN69_18505 [Acidobacteria bacterium]|nr:hypothetical protein [Acidobacteriota bacterium]